MQRLLPVVLFLLTCTSCYGITIEEIAESAFPSVVRIVTYDITGTRSSEASGFFISPQRIITNEHVVGSAYSAEVFTENGYFDLITIQNSDKATDLAIISVDFDDGIPLSTNLHTELKPGQRVIAIGNPLGLEKTLSDGLISAVRKIDKLQVLQITAPVSPGSSGGPLLDESGRVIGVVTATMHEGQNLNFAIGVQTLSQFLLKEEHPKKLKVAGSRVLWRVIVKWIVMVVAGLIAFAFGGGWWIIFILVLAVTLLWWLFSWIFKSSYRLVTLPFRRHHHYADINEEKSLSPLELSDAPSYNPDPEFDKGLVDEDEGIVGEYKYSDHITTLCCWKCGSVNYLEPETDKTIICFDCGATIPIPPELRDRE